MLNQIKMVQKHFAIVIFLLTKKQISVSFYFFLLLKKHSSEFPQSPVFISLIYVYIYNQLYSERPCGRSRTQIFPSRFTYFRQDLFFFPFTCLSRALVTFSFFSPNEKTKIPRSNQSACRNRSVIEIREPGSALPPRDQRRVGKGF